MGGFSTRLTRVGFKIEAPEFVSSPIFLLLFRHSILEPAHMFIFDFPLLDGVVARTAVLIVRLKASGKSACCSLLG